VITRLSQHTASPSNRYIRVPVDLIIPQSCKTIMLYIKKKNNGMKKTKGPAIARAFQQAADKELVLV